MAANLKTLTLNGTIKAYLSSVGYYGYWYCDLDLCVTLKDKSKIEHLYLWKNQNPYMAFSTRAENIQKGPISPDLDPDDLICVWIHEKSLLENIIDLKKNI